MPPKGGKNPKTPKNFQDHPHNVIPAEQKNKGKGKQRALEDIEMNDGGASVSSVIATQPHFNTDITGPNPTATSTSSTPPSITDIEGWSTEQLIQHLQDEFPDIKDTALNVLIEQEIGGRAFLMLTEEKLMKVGMKLGPASVIAGYIEKLKVAAQQEHAPKRKFEEDILEQLQAIREEIREDKKTTISISRITQKHLTALLKELGLSRRTVEFDVTPTTKHVSSFVWTDKKEDAHAQEYLTWLEGCINLPPGVKFYITSNKANLLFTTTVSSQFNISGTLDVAIVDKKYVRSRNITGGIRVGLELKKTVEDSNVMQAIVELIMASMYSEHPVVMALTDLGEEWQFFWLERGWVVDCVFDIKESITLLETIVQQPRPPVGQPTPDAPYLQRCDLKTAISQARESDGALPENTEVEGLERLLQRPKMDIMGLLPEDDVADMRDVFDVMTPNEIREWQMRRVLDFAMQTPAVQSSMSNEDWRSIYA